MVSRVSLIGRIGRWVVGLAACIALQVAARDEAPPPHAWPARVSYVVDGDSVWVLPDEGGRRLKLRIEGIDAPEICQAGGPEARDALKALVLGERVLVATKAHDRYGRAIATVWRAQSRVDVGAAMVRQGWAWNERYGRRAGKYARAQASAKSARLGVFADTRARYPAQFRREHGTCVTSPE